MSFEKTIEELNKLRNEEYERLRYDRSVWDGSYLGQSKMLDLAKKDIRSPEELETLEKEERMIKFYGRSPSYRVVDATRAETAKLVKVYEGEVITHKTVTSKALSTYHSQVEAFQHELHELLAKHQPKLSGTIAELAKLQSDERYLYNSKGLPTPFTLTGISMYHDHFNRNIHGDRVLTTGSSQDFNSWVDNYDEFQTIILNQAKGGN